MCNEASKAPTNPSKSQSAERKPRGHGLLWKWKWVAKKPFYEVPGLDGRGQIALSAGPPQPGFKA